MSIVDELYRFRMHRDGPIGFEPCTRDWPHDGPCAHKPEPGFLEFGVEYDAWLKRWFEVRNKYAEAMPCVDSNCCYRNPMCRNCRLGIDATDAICGGPPDPRDFKPETE